MSNVDLVCKNHFLWTLPSLLLTAGSEWHWLRLWIMKIIWRSETEQYPDKQLPYCYTIDQSKHQWLCETHWKPHQFTSSKPPHNKKSDSAVNVLFRLVTYGRIWCHFKISTDILLDVELWTLDLWCHVSLLAHLFHGCGSGRRVARPG